VEDALGVKVPENAELIRNLMIGAQYVHDHVMHFYHLHALDWVDVVSALGADSTATATLAKSNNPDYYANVSLATLKTNFDGVQGQTEKSIGQGTAWLVCQRLLGATRSTNSRQRGTCLPSPITWMRWAGLAKSSRCTRLLVARSPHPNLVVGGVPCSVSSNYGQQVSEDHGGTSLNQVQHGEGHGAYRQNEGFRRPRLRS